MSSHFRSLLPIIFLVMAPLLWAQSASDGSTSASALPTDPADFLRLAAKIDGLEAENVGPWHLKAIFEVYDSTGKVKDSGSFEGFWQSPSKYKFSYKSSGYSRTIWSNESGSYATSSPKWPGDIEWMIRRSLFDITPDTGDPREWSLRFRDVTAGVRLKCIDFVPKFELTYGFPASAFPFYCFDFNTPALRSGSGLLQHYQAIYNNIVSFAGAYIPGDVELMHESVPYFRLHVVSIEPLALTSGNPFRPDSGAKPTPRQLVIDSDVRWMHATREWGIQHPFDYRLHRALPLGQEIIVQVLVNTKGHVVNERAITGNPQMQFEGVAAASHWQFEPYMVNGTPIEFYTELEFY